MSNSFYCWVIFAVTLMVGGLPGIGRGEEPSWGMRIDIDGKAGKVELKPAELADNDNIKNITWGNPDERKFYLMAQKKGFCSEQWVVEKFTFVPESDGIVKIALGGCWAKRPDVAFQDQEWVEYRKIEVEGAVLANGDFSDRDGNGWPKAWRFDPSVKMVNKWIKVWNKARAVQNIRVTAGQPVKIKVEAKNGGTVLAATQAKSLLFNHGPWALSVCGDSGAWESLKWKDKLVACNPNNSPMFSLESPDFKLQGQCRLKAHRFDPERGVLVLSTTFNEWLFEERIELGKRIKREVYVTWRGNKPVKFSGFKFYLYLSKSADYYFPRTLFGDNRHYMAMADDPYCEVDFAGSLSSLKTGETIKGVFDCYFSFFEFSDNKTMMLAFDGRREPTGLSIQSLGDFVRSQTYVGAAGWAEPNVRQVIGPQYIEMCDGDIQASLRIAPHNWYRDIGMVTPADRPEWIKDITSLWVACPSPLYGGVNGFSHAINEMIPHIVKRGANALWLLPLSPKSLYGIRDYYDLRAEVGSKDDYKDFLVAAHKNKLHVWQDIIPHGGLPEYAQLRGVSPFTLTVNEKGEVKRGTSFDYCSTEWRKYIYDVADYYMTNFDIDGFRIDQCGFSQPNWRRPGFPAKAPKRLDEKWWNDAVAQNGGELPPLEAPRASYALREAGRILTKGIRDVVRKHKKNGAVLAETETISCVPSGDFIFDFFIRRVCFKMPLYDGEATACHLARYFDEQQFVDPPQTSRIRFMEVHDAQQQRFNNWCGERGGRALRSALFWSKGVPLIQSSCDTGMGTFFAKLNSIRSVLPEFRYGEAEYQAVKSKPAVFSALRVLPDKSSIGITSFLSKPVHTRLQIPVEMLGFESDDELVLYNCWTEKNIGNGKLDSFRELEIDIPAYGNAVLTWRKSGTACPVSPSPKLLYPKSSPKTVSVKETVSEFVVEGENILVVDRQSGLIKRFGSWIDNSTIIADSVISDSEAQVTVNDVSDKSVVIEAKLASGATIIYSTDGSELSIDATLDKFSAKEREALVLSFANARRWQVNCMEGRLDDWIDKENIDANLRGFMPKGSQTYRPTRSPILWHSEIKPLNFNCPKIKIFDKNNVGCEVEIVDVFSTTYDDAMLLDKLPGRSGLHTAFFWVQPGPLSFAEKGERRQFKLVIRPAVPDGEKYSTTVNGVKVTHESLFWLLENGKYSLRLTRSGGMIKEMLDGKSNPVIARQDIVVCKDSQKIVARASLDLDGGVRCYREGGALKFRFISALRNGGNQGLLNPAIWAITDYALDDSDVLKQNYHIYVEGVPVGTKVYGRGPIDMPQIAYVFDDKGKQNSVPVCDSGISLKARRFYSSAAEISTLTGFKKVGATKENTPVISWKRFWQIYSLKDNKFIPLMVASCFPGNSIVSWHELTNVKFVEGYKAPAAVEIQMPAWANVGPILDLKPGKYKIRTWIKGKDIVQKGGRAWLELRFQWHANHKALRKSKRFDIPEGNFDWQLFEADLEIPKDAPVPVSVILAPAMDGLGSGTLLADIPELIAE